MIAVMIKGKEVKFCEKDYVFFKHCKLSIGKNGYCFIIKHTNKKNILFYAHQLILGKKKSLIIDHINGDKLDNRRCNLRFSNKSLNGLNSKLRKDSTTGHKGVFKHSRGSGYYAKISVNGKPHYLGYYQKIEDAVAVRKKAFEELVDFNVKE